MQNVHKSGGTWFLPISLSISLEKIVITNVITQISLLFSRIHFQQYDMIHDSLLNLFDNFEIIIKYEYEFNLILSLYHVVGKALILI